MTLSNPYTSTTSSSMTEAWDDLDANTQPQLKAEPLSPFVGPSLSLDLSHSQLHSDPQVETFQSPSVPMTTPLSAGQSHVSSMAQTSTSALNTRTTSHTSQLPPAPPLLSLHHSHPPQPSRNTLQSHAQSLCSSPPGIQQQHQLGLAHLSDLMTGNLMLNKTSASTSDLGSKPSLMPSQAMFNDQGNSFIPLQHPQATSSHSAEDAFVYEPSTAPFYVTHQVQQHQQQHQHQRPSQCQDDCIMSRGSSSSSSCSTCSSTVIQQEQGPLSGPSMKRTESTGIPMTASELGTMKTENEQTAGVALADKMDDFYDRLLNMSFEQSADAIAKCRELAREHGFTVKQETSSNKNVYLYCSREGMPDSVKNNKEIKRKRSSMRCDCKWRITLFQHEDIWVFRKAVNPASMIHNHTLISPEAIRQPWPPAVFDKIAYYARQRSLSTADTRDRIKEDFPGLVWDERRFYNRLTEERKQIRHRDSENRVFNTMDLAAKVASLASSDANLSCRVIKTMENMFNELCDQLRVDPTSAASRVFTSSSPPTSAGGGGSVGASGASMTMTSPMSTSPGLYPSSGTSGTPQTSDHLVTYPGCIISVKSTSNQKGRPSSMSSPTADSNYGLGLGASSSLNDRKRSLSDECFTRTGLPSATASSFGSAMNAPSMMGHLDISAAAASGLGGSLSGLDPVMPGNSGLLMMQGGSYHPHSGSSHTHQQPQQQPHQPIQYHPQDPQAHHGNSHLSSGMTTFRHPSFSQPSPSQPHHHPQHPSHHQQLQQHQQQHQPTGLSPDNLSDMSLEMDSYEPPRQEPAPVTKRANSMDIKQETQLYQSLSTPQIANNSQMPRRASGSPGPGGSTRLFHPYAASATTVVAAAAPPGVIPHSSPSAQQVQAISSHPGFHSGQLLAGGGAESDEMFTFSTTPGQYNYSGNNGGYFHPGYTGANQQASNSSPTMNNTIQPSAFGQHDRVRL